MVPEPDLRSAHGDVEILEMGARDDQAYESFVRHHRHALLYHSLRFRDFLVELLGCQARYGVARAGGEVVGVLPVMAADGPYGRVLNSLPYFGSNGGMLAEAPAVRTALSGWYAELASSADVAASTLIANPLDPEADPPEHDLSDVRVGCMTALGGGGDPAPRLTLMIDGSARRNVAKATRSGVKVEIDNDAFDALEQLHRAGMEAIDGRAKTPSFFEAVRRCFRAGDDYALYVARIDDEVVAALLVFFYGSVAEYYVPASRPESRPAQPMAAILQQAMVDADTRGLRWWNWGGSWVSQENLIRFKVKWGGQPREYRYWTKINNPDILTAEPQNLLDGYPGFYVAPFSSLRRGNGGSE